MDHEGNLFICFIYHNTGCFLKENWIAAWLWLALSNHCADRNLWLRKKLFWRMFVAGQSSSFRPAISSPMILHHTPWATLLVSPRKCWPYIWLHVSPSKKDKKNISFFLDYNLFVLFVCFVWIWCTVVILFTRCRSAWWLSMMVSSWRVWSMNSLKLTSQTLLFDWSWSIFSTMWVTLMRYIYIRTVFDHLCGSMSYGAIHALFSNNK